VTNRRHTSASGDNSLLPADLDVQGRSWAGGTFVPMKDLTPEQYARAMAFFQQSGYGRYFIGEETQKTTGTYQQV
jgi:hypothetical protein